MKKFIIAAALGVFGVLSVQAQEIDFGVKVGANFAKLQGDDIEDANGRTGIHVGLTGEYMFGESFGLQVEAVYS
ncbi:MAG: PorT family protein, partial [Nonlabens sp.]|nr:PorT family protein [Nonlabens sp.]